MCTCITLRTINQDSLLAGFSLASVRCSHHSMCQREAATRDFEFSPCEWHEIWRGLDKQQRLNLGMVQVHVLGKLRSSWSLTVLVHAQPNSQRHLPEIQSNFMPIFGIFDPTPDQVFIVRMQQTTSANNKTTSIPYL